MNPDHYSSGNPEAIRADLPRQAEHQAASANLFLRTARAGRSRGASTGERTAHRLAVALHEIGDDLALLDGTTLEGFINIVRASAGPWPTEDAKHQVFQALAVAGSGAPTQKSMARTAATTGNKGSKRASKVAVASRTQVNQGQYESLKLDQETQRAAHLKRIRMAGTEVVADGSPEFEFSGLPARTSALHDIGEAKHCLNSAFEAGSSTHSDSLTTPAYHLP